LHAVVATPDGTILGRARKKTKAELGIEAVIGRVADVLAEACGEAGVETCAARAVGVAVPAPVRRDGSVVFAANLGWRDVPVAAMLSQRLGLMVFAENDCNLGALAEYRFGAGRNSRMLVALFMGTGLGGGIVHDGKLWSGANNMAAEVGHMIVRMDGRPCGCGRRGCLEAYASKTAMTGRFREEVLEKGRRTLLKDGDDGFSKLRSGALADAFRCGDEVTREIVLEAAEVLGLGIGNLITLLGPDAVVLGGGVFEALGPELLETARNSARKYSFPEASFVDARIELASLGDDAVALGAAAYAWEGFLEHRGRMA
ncbi:MAG: ROK family protein, partial [Planctomycetota bacterium]|nr:ROK family protein [Planctomycetota bacterium]